MEKIVSGTTGLLHLIFSIFALVTGLLVLVSPKGTRRHRQIGYVYSVSMILLNGTAFMIYRLFGNFGIFHGFAIVSTLTLFAGLYPVFTRKDKNYLLIHFNFMYWSVVGLYCALMAEIFSRLPHIVLTEDGKPNTMFYNGVGIGVAVVMTIAITFFLKYKPRWSQQFGPQN